MCWRFDVGLVLHFSHCRELVRIYCPAMTTTSESNHWKIIRKVLLCETSSLITDEYGHLTASSAQKPALCCSTDKTEPLLLLNECVHGELMRTIRHIDKSNEAAHLNLTSRANHIAVDRDKSAADNGLM